MSTFSTLMRFSDDLSNSTVDLQIKTVIVYMLYSFIDHTKTNIKDTAKLAKVIIAKSSEFTEEIEHLKGMPYYIKLIIINKIRKVSNNISDMMSLPNI